MTKKVVKLVDLTARSEVELPSGRTVEVKPLDAAGYELLKELSDTQDDAKLWQLAALALPTATPEETRALTAKQCTVVLALAREMVEMVETLMGNVQAPPPSPAAEPPSE